MHRIFKNMQPRILASNISGTCLLIELIILLVVIPICMANHLDAARPVVTNIFSLSAGLGIGCAIIAAQQPKTTRS